MLSKLEGVTNRNDKQASAVPDAEVVVRAKRRRFSTAYKLRILQAADACQERGAIGALLRREGLYSSHLSTWRKQRVAGELVDKKRGRKGEPAAAEVKRLKRENEWLRRELEKAQLVIEVQKKLSQVLGLSETQLDDNA